MREAKAALRTALRAVVIDELHRRDASARIADTITHHPAFTDATSIAAFVGVRNEPDTSAILRAAITQHKHLFLPRVADRHRLAWSRVHDLDSLLPSPYGLLEPAPSLPSTLHLPDAIELVLVPGLAFASDGARIGHGRGYYDRTLAAHTTATLVGVTLQRFLDPPEGPIPTADHDVRMHAILTERDLTVIAPLTSPRSAR